MIFNTILVDISKSFGQVRLFLSQAFQNTVNTISLLPAEGGLPRGGNSKQQAAAAASKGAKTRASKSADTLVTDMGVGHLTGLGVGGLNDTVLQTSCFELGFHLQI